MDSPHDVFPAENRCEVCGGKLGDEIVIQEFADGSLARLCPECAAGTALEEHRRPERRPDEVVWPTEPVDPSASRYGDFDPLEKTRELLMPVADLIALQSEMQSALERLAASLERFASEMVTETQSKSAVESRVQMLERELEATRARLEETEFLLVSTTAETPLPADILATAKDKPASNADLPTPAEAVPAAAAAAPVAAETTPSPTTFPEDTLETAVAADLEAARDDLWSRLESRAQAPLEPQPVSEPSPLGPDETVAPSAEPTPAVALVPPPGVAPAPQPEPAPTTEPAPAAEVETHGTGFRIEEVQAAQRYYNESPFTSRVRDVKRSLGKPKANLTRVPGDEPRAIVTVAWDIVWYQYLVDLNRDVPSTHERVVLHREGMDLDELAYYFKEPNAVINDDGRVDASELEVRLLSDPSALITEMTPLEMQALEDATEEIWDQRVAPEFKWDD